MYRGGSRFVPILLLLIVVVAAIIGLVALGRAILGGTAQLTENDPASKALLTTDADYSVRMTVRGPIVAEENFRSYTVTVSPSSRQMQTYSGYDNHVLDSTRLSNNLEAYTQFVGALNRARFVQGANLSDIQNDTDGVCADGRLYTFELLQAQSSVKRLWTASCRGGSGSFRGNTTMVRDFFLRQIPNSANLLQAINLTV